MNSARVLLIDNFDSFTYNLAQAFQAGGAEVVTVRNNAVDVAAAKALQPSHVCISPGPGTPSDAGVSKAIIEAFAGERPVLGVCLGHQAIVEVFGGSIIRAPRPMHGKTSRVRHDGKGVFAGLPQPFEAGRYHSLIAARPSLPDCFEISAHCEDALMGVRHKALAIEGVQFHPESILTPAGRDLLANFLAMSGSCVGETAT